MGAVTKHDLASYQGPEPVSNTSGAADNTSLIWTVHTRGGSFRIHLAGREDALKAVVSPLNDIADMAPGPDAFLEAAWSVLADNDVRLADVLDVGPRAAQLRFLDVVRTIARVPNASEALSKLVVLFTIAERDDVLSTIGSAQGNWIRSYVASVLDAFDDERESARQRLTTALNDEALAYLFGLMD